MNDSPAPVRLGAHVFDPVLGELLDGQGAPVALRRQVLLLLRVLAGRPDEVVSKDELFDLVWPGVVVTEGSLTQAVSELRRVLGDDGHRLVRNVARRGYRLVPDAPPEQLPMLSIVVLPFTLEGAHDGADWLADALHGDLILELGRLPGSIVISRETSRQFAADSDPRALTAELCVRTVLGGRLRFEGSQLRLLLHRIDGASGQQLGSLTLLCERADLPSGVADLALRTARLLQPELVLDAAREIARLSPAQLGAEALTLQATALLFRGLAPEHLQQGRKLLERALALDPDRRSALKLLATLTIQSLINGWVDDEPAAQRQIDEVVERLHALEAGSVDELTVRAIQAFLRGDARTMLRLARLLCDQQRHPVHLGTRGMAAVLCGEAEEAADALVLALRLSPRDPMRAEWLFRLAAAKFMLGEDDEAVSFAESGIDANPALNWPPIHAAALWRIGARNAARRALREHEERLGSTGHAALERRLPGQHPRLQAMRGNLRDLLDTVAAPA